MSYTDDEVSVEDSQPREGIELVFPAFTDRIATGDQPITINGNLYTPYPAQRGEQVFSIVGSATGMQLTIPVQQRGVQRYLANGIPPRAVTVNVYRQQVRSGEYVLVWTGSWDSLSTNKHLATIQVVPKQSKAMQRKLPTIVASRSCPHVLYDTQCRKDRASFNVSTTVTALDGLNVTVASMSAHPDQWAQYGELLHTASGERMTVGAQVGTTITMQCPIPEIKIGDSVTVYAGCDHTIATCRDKFANVVNFGGFPSLLDANPFLPWGLGITRTAL